MATCYADRSSELMGSHVEFGIAALVVGGALSAFAAVAHLACIAMGAPAYRVMGASERMVRAAEQGKPRPALITLFIAMIWFICAGYALAGAWHH